MLRYDYPSSTPGLKPVKTAFSSTLYVITHTMLNPSHLLCKTSQVAYVCHHMHYTWNHIHILWQQPFLFVTSQALYSLHYTHCIWHLIYSVWCHIHYVCYITQWLYLCHQTLYVYDIFTCYGIMQCYDHTTIVYLHSHYAWHYTQCISDITHNIPILWKGVNVCHHSLYKYDTICTTYDITSTLYNITTLYLWRQFYYI